jgi:transcriptional regulator with GAF, ATPase, and Fis domain
LVAQDIFNLSSRSEGPFIKINCAAVSESLMESEFFGHEKGAYTGATERREGRFELANGGTLLLDEISEVPLHLQAKLLRVLQERELERVGGSKTIKVDVRVIATTNRDMKRAVANGEFREDLYYRLNVFPIHIAPLRERKEDIPMLAEHFLHAGCKHYGRKISGFSPESLHAMENWAWNGNVRELQNCIERAVILTQEHSFIEPNALGLNLPDYSVRAEVQTAIEPKIAPPVEEKKSSPLHPSPRLTSWKNVTSCTP